MCRQITCKKCNKATWAGCGAHVEEVLGHLTQSQLCQCGSGPIASAPAKKKWFSR